MAAELNKSPIAHSGRGRGARGRGRGRGATPLRPQKTPQLKEPFAKPAQDWDEPEDGMDEDLPFDTSDERFQSELRAAVEHAKSTAEDSKKTRDSFIGARPNMAGSARPVNPLLKASAAEFVPLSAESVAMPNARPSAISARAVFKADHKAEAAGAMTNEAMTIYATNLSHTAFDNRDHVANLKKSMEQA